MFLRPCTGNLKTKKGHKPPSGACMAYMDIDGIVPHVVLVPCILMPRLVFHHNDQVLRCKQMQNLYFLILQNSITSNSNVHKELGITNEEHWGPVGHILCNISPINSFHDENIPWSKQQTAVNRSFCSDVNVICTDWHSLNRNVQSKCILGAVSQSGSLSTFHRTWTIELVYLYWTGCLPYPTHTISFLYQIWYRLLPAWLLG